MSFPRNAARLFILVLLLPALVTTEVKAQFALTSKKEETPERIIVSSLSRYYDSAQGITATEIISKALQTNGELQAARLEIDRARARLRQAGLLLNPSVDFEQTTGRFTGSRGESETSVGVSYPIELGGKRGKRKALAQAELEVIEAEVKMRERILTGEVLLAYTEALAALRELEITEDITEIDLQTTRFVQIRVNEGDAAPLELNLLQTEVERLRSRRTLAEGKLQAALLRLKALAGMSETEPLILREQITAPALVEPTTSLSAAIDIALRTRPDLQLARLSEEAAEAGLQLARADSIPNLIASTRYGQSRSSFDDTPIGVLTDRDKTLTFGVSIEIPVFNRNQTKKEEAAIAIVQAKRRREFLESVIRSEVTSAFARHRAAQTALLSFEQGVIQRSTDNIRIIRTVYELGQFKITELLAEQRRLLESQSEFTQILSERYRSLVDLHLAMGVPMQK